MEIPVIGVLSRSFSTHWPFRIGYRGRLCFSVCFRPF